MGRGGGGGRLRGRGRVLSVKGWGCVYCLFYGVKLGAGRTAGVVVGAVLYSTILDTFSTVREVGIAGDDVPDRSV